MIIPDESLADEHELDRVRECMHEEEGAWGSSERDKRLKARYWRAPQSVYRDLNVQWDLRRQAKRLNWDAAVDYLEAFRLYECDSATLLSHLSYSDNFRFARVFEGTEQVNFLRVVGHWETGTPLSPPALKLLEDGKLGKFDGFHRLAVAFAARTPVIPFWAVLPDTLAGVRLIDER
jgi:hypothetical protein